ncbi:hypothetical protein P3G55_18860 [Leptospira sp. 96542]|nr:hypothetical protein [Leptospira sp. 96542]
MAVKLNPAPTFWQDVKLTVPGEVEPALVSLKFVYMTAEQLQPFFEANAGQPVASAISKIVLDWGDKSFMGDDGAYVPFSSRALAQVLNSYSPAAGEIWGQWMRSLMESRVKN